MRTNRADGDIGRGGVAQVEPVSTQHSKKQTAIFKVYTCMSESEKKNREAPYDEGSLPGLALDGAEACFRVDEGLFAGAGDSWDGIPDEDTGAIVAVVGLQTL